VRIFPRILPPYVSSLFWTIVLVVALLLLHAPVGRWLDDLVAGKAVIAVVALVVGGIARLRRRAADGRGPVGAGDGPGPTAS
jgi:hypothetical protein